MDSRIMNNRESKSGVTLMELLIAIILLALILIGGSGIYLSGWRMFRDAQFVTQAQRNAAVPMIHMARNLQKAISFTEVAGPPRELRYSEYTSAGIINKTYTTTISRYIFSGNQIQYDPDLNDNSGNEIVIGTHIKYDAPDPTTFTVSGSFIAVDVTITAEDNRSQNLNRYTTKSKIEARCGSTPPV